eukprot:3021975-Prymnesium_polylepis.1
MVAMRRTRDKFLRHVLRTHVKRRRIKPKIGPVKPMCYETAGRFIHPRKFPGLRYRDDAAPGARDLVRRPRSSRVTSEDPLNVDRSRVVTLR